MEISGQGVSAPIQGGNHYVESGEAYSGRGAAAVDSKNMLLNSLEPGSYLYGQVQSCNEDGAVLLLENGQKLLAKLAEGVTLIPGQNVTFQVERKQDGMVYMKPLFAQAALEMTAGKALKGAGFMSTPKNLEIVKELLELNMPVDKSTIRSMLQKSVTNPEVPVKQLALFEKLGIPVTKENMEQLKQYQASEHQIGRQMERLLKDLSTVTEQLFTEGKTEEAVNLNQKVLDFLYEELSQQGQNPEGIEKGQINGETAEGEAALKNLAKEAVLGELGEGNGTVEEAVVEGGKASILETVAEGEKGSILEAAGGEKILAGEIVSGGENVPAGEVVSGGEKVLTGEGLAEDSERLAKEALPDGEKDRMSVPLSEEMENLGNGKPLGAEEKNLFAESPELADSQIRKSGEEVSNLKERMFEMKKLLGELKNPAEMKKLLSSTRFQEILERGMKEAWQMKPSEFNGKESINRSYARVEEQTRLLGELLRESGQEAGSSLKTAANVQQNLEFMQDLNQVFPYVQLPLQMAGESAHGDLYVFKDKKKQHEAGEPFTAFLHLSMEHLGDVDVYLSLQEQKVATDITLEQKAVMDLFETHIDELIGRLEKKGYEVSAKLKIGEKKPDFVEDVLAKQAGGSSVSRYSFDVKA